MKKTPTKILTATIITITLTLAIPLTVSAIQNIFMGGKKIADIQLNGQKVSKIYHQGEIIWEQPPSGPPPIQNGSPMQTVTAANCPDTRTRVYDARDNHTYWIRKIPNTTQGKTGDLCWMETNLAYAGDGNNTYGDVTPTGTTTTVLNVVSSTSLSGSQDDSTCYLNALRPCVYTALSGNNPTTEPTNPSTSTTGTGQHGYLYNWCAAMNAQPSACQITTATQPNQQINGNTPSTQYNICPAGWRLPINSGFTNSSNEQYNLVTALGWTSGAPTPLFTNGLYMYSGRWTNGSFSNQGNYGYYWSSTTSNATNAYDFAFPTANVFPSNSIAKRQAYAIRCVAP